MNKIALVSVTLNAVNPMVECFRDKMPNAIIHNYLDSYLLEKVRANGGISDSSMRRMFDMVSQACYDGADAVLITCTIFSPYATQFSELLSKPIICPDKAMLESVAARPGRTAIICTFPGTVETTRGMYLDCCNRLGIDSSVDMIVVEEAYLAANHSDFETHDRVIRNKVAQIDAQYENIVFAQISMARAAKGLSTKHATVFTSPESACATVARLLN